MIEQFRTLNIQPAVVAAGAWHAAVVGSDGRVCTWGWGRYGCLGHGNEDCESVPKVVESLSKVKAVHVATGDYTTFVVSDEGNVYSFGCGESSSLGHNTAAADEQVISYLAFSFCHRNSFSVNNWVHASQLYPLDCQSLGFYPHNPPSSLTFI